MVNGVGWVRMIVNFWKKGRKKKISVIKYLNS